MNKLRELIKKDRLIKKGRMGYDPSVGAALKLYLYFRASEIADLIEAADDVCHIPQGDLRKELNRVVRLAETVKALQEKE